MVIIPEIFRTVPSILESAQPPPTAEEVRYADAVRQRYLVPGQPVPYMVDIVRVGRLLRGTRRYAEVGTRDRGNIAYFATFMDTAPVIVDIDIEPMQRNEEMIARELQERSASYNLIHGNSVSPAVVALAAAALTPAGADVIFCDSSHMYEHTLAEFDAYWPLVRPGGILMFHDACWEGTAMDKGKHQALIALDRIVPVYLAFTTEPLHRILPRSSKGDTWGGVAIIPKLEGA